MSEKRGISRQKKKTETKGKIGEDHEPAGLHGWSHCRLCARLRGWLLSWLQQTNNNI